MRDAMSISGHAVVDLLRVVPSHVVQTNRGAVTLEWGPIVWRILSWVLLQSTSLAQWFNKYHAGLEVMGSIPMGDLHI